MKKIMHVAVVLTMFFITSATATGFLGVQKKDLEKFGGRAQAVKERAQKLIANPFFLSVLGCISYAGPKTIVRSHPFLSIMGVGFVLSYLKGDMSIAVEGAEISFRVLKKENKREEN